MSSPSRVPLDPEQVEGALRGVATGRVLVVPRTASTSTDLVEAATADPDRWPDRSVLVADHQQAGRGRSGRTWTTPAHTALTVSVLLRPGAPAGGGVPVDRFGWVPLITGLAVVQAVREVAGVAAGLKWPNDVLVEAPDGVDVPGWGARRKVAGILGDVLSGPGGPAVVVGVGVNVSQQPEELPVPWASSLTLARSGRGGHGEDVDRVALLQALVSRLVALDERWRAARGEAGAAGLQAECSAVCATLGRPVRVELPGGEVLDGTATGLAPDGALEVTDGLGAVRTVVAGDVHHLRGG